MKPPWTSLLWRWLPRDIRTRVLYTERLATDLFAPLPVPAKYTFVTQVCQRLGYPTFVETGTYRGAMAHHASHLFPIVHTIELCPKLAGLASAALARLPNVTVHQGDSGQVLHRILPRIDTSCVFWLDAHYSGGDTARGQKDTPILAELEAIAAHPVRPHAILIDDARIFGLDEAYPTIEEIFARLRQVDPALRIGVSTDLIWAAPVKILSFEWLTTPSGITVPPSTGPGESRRKREETPRHARPRPRAARCSGRVAASAGVPSALSSAARAAGRPAEASAGPLRRDGAAR